MEKHRQWLDLISVVALSAMLLACFYLWLQGVDTNAKLQFYLQLPRWLTLGAVAVLGLNVGRLETGDVIWLVIAVLSVIVFSFFADLRQADFFLNAIPATFIILVLDFKLVPFSQRVRLALAILSAFLLLVTFYRILTEIPQPPNGRSIWAPGNELKAIWVNTNTIGELVMCETLLAICLFQSSLKRSFFLTLPLAVVGLAGTWVVQSKAALYALVVFCGLQLINQFLKGKGRFIYGSGISLFLLLILPLSYVAAKAESINLFTGREEIWRDFFNQLVKSREQIWLGMKPFVFYRNGEALSYHSSYVALWGHFGLLGVILVLSFILYMVWQIVLQKERVQLRLSFLIGFIAILLQSMMEETLVAVFWFPLTISLLGLALQNFEKTLPSAKNTRTTRSYRHQK